MRLFTADFFCRSNRFSVGDTATLFQVQLPLTTVNANMPHNVVLFFTQLGLRTTPWKFTSLSLQHSHLYTTLTFDLWLCKHFYCCSIYRCIMFLLHCGSRAGDKSTLVTYLLTCHTVLVASWCITVVYSIDGLWFMTVMLPLALKNIKKV